jgi:hypothetical protein
VILAKQFGSGGNMAKEEKTVPVQKRQSVRVRDLARLRVSLIEDKHRQAAIERIALERLTSSPEKAAVQIPPVDDEIRRRLETANSQIMNRLAAIETKIDAVLAHLAEQDLAKRWGELLPVNLSAGGILFPHGEAFARGTLLRVEFMLQTVPLQPILTAAEVVRVATPDPAWSANLPHVIGVKFIDLDPEDADRIAKRVFEVQRMLLRRSREEGDTASLAAGRSVRR